MNSLVESALSNAIMVTVLAILAALVSRAVRRPALSHAIWVLVLVKLVTPPVAVVPIGVNWGAPSEWVSPTEVAQPSVSAEDPTPVLETVPETPPLAEEPPGQFEAVARASESLASVASSADRTPHIALDGPPESLETSPPHPVPAIPVQPSDDRQKSFVTSQPADADGADREATSAAAAVESAGQQDVTGQRPRRAWMHWDAAVWLSGLLLVWCAGSLIWLGRQLWGVAGFCRYLSCGQAAPEEIQSQSRKLARAMGLRRWPAVWIVPGCVSPMLWALGPKARLIFPAELLVRLPEDARATLLSHELAHYRRGDHWVRLLEVLVGTLYWWHPVVWWARREIEAAEEECCDAWVVEQFPGAPRRYAEALLDTIDFLSESPTKLPAAVSGLGEVPLIKRRLTQIMRGVRPKALSLPGRLVILMLAVLLLPLQPALFGPREGWLEAAPHNRRTHELWPLENRALSPGSLPPGDREERPSQSPMVASVTHSTVVGNAEQTESFPFVPSDPWATVHSPQRRTVITAAHRSVLVENTLTGTVTDLSDYGITSVAFSPDGRRFATGGLDGSVRLFESTTGREEFAFPGTHSDLVRSVAFSPDGQVLVSGSRDGAVQFWDVPGRQALAALPRQSAAVSCVRFAPDGTVFAAASGDWTMSGTSGWVTLWDVSTGPQNRLSVSKKAVVECEFPPGAIMFQAGGTSLAVADWSGRVSFWSADTGQRLVPGFAQMSKASVSAAQFSPDVNDLTRITISEVRTPAVTRSTARYFDVASPRGSRERFGSFSVPEGESGRPISVNGLVPFPRQTPPKGAPRERLLPEIQVHSSAAKP